MTDNESDEKKLQHTIKNLLWWNLPIRLQLFFYFIEAICIFIGLKTFTWPARFTWSHLFNNVFIICCFVAIIAFPFFILCFYLYHKRKFEEENWCETFNAKYGTVYGHLKTNSMLLPRNAVIFLYSFFVFRRLIFALVIVFLAHRPGVQIAIMLFTCVVAVGYFATYMPFVEPVYNYLHIANEVTLIILLNMMWWY